MDALVANALEQPQVFVHRDYHSRNLMVCPDANPGIIDFQDAVRGSFTYDLVSLLRDSYIAWPQERVVGSALEFRRLSPARVASAGPGRAPFLRWFDLMGVQRHLKVAASSRACGIAMARAVTSTTCRAYSTTCATRRHATPSWPSSPPGSKAGWLPGLAAANARASWPEPGRG